MNPRLARNVAFVVVMALGKVASAADVTSPGLLQVEASSEPRFSDDEATAEARYRLEDALVDRLRAWLPHALPNPELRRRLPQLLGLTAVTEEATLETIDKPYGRLYRRCVTVTAARETAEDWLEQQAIQWRHVRRLHAAGAFLTVAGFFAAVGLAIRLDRWTRGYHRAAVLAAAFAIWLCGTSIAWLAVLDWQPWGRWRPRSSTAQFESTTCRRPIPADPTRCPPTAR
jgi:hypothetical protein